MDNQNMAGQNMTDQNQQGDQAQQQDQNQQGKTFTQDEVNRIVSERLARAKNTADHGDFTERENALNQRENAPRCKGKARGCRDTERLTATC